MNALIQALLTPTTTPADFSIPSPFPLDESNYSIQYMDALTLALSTPTDFATAPSPLDESRLLFFPFFNDRFKLPFSILNFL